MLEAVNLSYTFQSVFLELRRSMRLSLPLVCSQLIYALSGMITMIMVAHLGRDELATNALVWGIYITLVLFFIGVLNAVSGLVAQNHGANDDNGIHTVVTQGVILAFIFTIPMMMVMWFAPEILRWTGQNPVTIKLAVPYCHALALGMLPLNLLFVLEQFLIGISITRIVLFLSLLKVPLEIFFIYILLFGKLGAPKLGLTGVGYGITLSVSTIALIVSCYTFFSKKCRQYRIFHDFFKINNKHLCKLIRIGLPLGGMYCIELALFATATFMMGRFGTDSLAAHQIAYQCLVFTLTITFGISQGTAVRIGYETGRNNKTALKLIAYVNMGIGFCFMLAMAVLYIGFPDNIIVLGIDIYALKNQVLVKQTVVFLSLAAVLQCIDCFRLISVGALRGLNDTKIPMCISIMAFWLIAFPGAYLLAFVLHLGGVGIWLGLIIGLFVGTIALLKRLKYLVSSHDLNAIMTK
jgi:multidrug resistance protein, MATE family